jgi:hypothetical protein
MLAMAVYPLSTFYSPAPLRNLFGAPHFRKEPWQDQGRVGALGMHTEPPTAIREDLNSSITGQMIRTRSAGGVHVNRLMLAAASKPHDEASGSAPECRSPSMRSPRMARGRWSKPCPTAGLLFTTCPGL